MGAYIIRTVVAPIIYQLLIFRGITASAINWRVLDIKRSEPTRCDDSEMIS